MQNDLYQAIYKSINKIILESLYAFYKRKNLDLNSIQSDLKLTKLIKGTFNLLGLFCEDFDHFEFFSTAKETIVKDIVLVNLISSQTDHDNFDNNIDEYINSMEDKIYINASETI